MNVTAWDITLIEFLVKFCDRNKSKLKLRFNALDYSKTSGDIIVGKTLIINEDNYIPDMIRKFDVKEIDAEDGYIVITLNGTIGNDQLKELISKTYTFEEDQKYWSWKGR